MSKDKAGHTGQRGDKKQNLIPKEKVGRLHSMDKDRSLFQCFMKKEKRSSTDAGTFVELWAEEFPIRWFLFSL